MTRAGTKAAKSILEERLKLGLSSEEFMVMKVLQGKPMTISELYLFFGVDEKKESKLRNAVDVLKEKKIVIISETGTCEVQKLG